MDRRTGHSGATRSHRALPGPGRIARMPKDQRLPPPFVVRSVIAARQAVLRLADMLVPPEAAVWEHLAGVSRTMLVHTAVRYEIADHLASGPKTAEQLARATGTNADAL